MGGNANARTSGVGYVCSLHQDPLTSHDHQDIILLGDTRTEIDRVLDNLHDIRERSSDFSI